LTLNDPANIDRGATVAQATLVQRQWLPRHCGRTCNRDRPKVPGSARGSHAAQPLPALIGEQRLLRQILDGLTRDPKVYRFKSHRAMVVHESQRMQRVVALSAFGQQLCQGGRWP
jgi:hypothetical protein